MIIYIRECPLRRQSSQPTTELNRRAALRELRPGRLNKKLHPEVIQGCLVALLCACGGCGGKRVGHMKRGRLLPQMEGKSMVLSPRACVSDPWLMTEGHHHHYSRPLRGAYSVCIVPLTHLERGHVAFLK